MELKTGSIIRTKQITENVGGQFINKTIAEPNHVICVVLEVVKKDYSLDTLAIRERIMSCGFFASPDIQEFLGPEKSAEFIKFIFEKYKPTEEELAAKPKEKSRLILL